MKNLKQMLGVSALSVMICLSACKDDDPKPDACESGTFEATVNGEHAAATSFNNTLLKASSGGYEGKRMDIRATDAEGRQLIITFNDLSTGLDGNGVSTDGYIAIDQVTSPTQNTFMFTIIEDGISYSFIDGTFDITSCDANAKKVSGTFSFSDEGFAVTSGSFTNMCYTVLN